MSPTAMKATELKEKIESAISRFGPDLQIEGCSFYSPGYGTPELIVDTERGVLIIEVPEPGDDPDLQPKYIRL